MVCDSLCCVRPVVLRYPDGTDTLARRCDCVRWNTDHGARKYPNIGKLGVDKWYA
ncbi:uncharacterized protein METZ01_LOCUS83328 [marine metagenome]|uniref:Uncharacterized protein n=1 Tax=marine metagenome TaxID=408172 RepID=A0A381URA8_9ZZZZ